MAVADRTRSRAEQEVHQLGALGGGGPAATRGTGQVQGADTDRESERAHSRIARSSVQCRGLTSRPIMATRRSRGGCSARASIRRCSASLQSPQESTRAFLNEVMSWKWW
ncbi:Uncharacterised protein [Mycobacteroides abscessus subsp. abscessus]|nr:Uncharacterised protein [Mycobacteroides abscessus subsp. abscessus]